MNARLNLLLSVSLAGSVLLTLLGGCSSSNTSPTAPASTYTASVSVSALNFSSIVGFGSTQSVILSNTGTGSLSLGTVALSGANVAFFTQTNTCGAGLAAGASCTATVTFLATGSGSDTATLSFADNATNGPHTVALAGVASGSASAALTVDCSLTALHCPDSFSGGFTDAAAPLASDPISTGGFHGYADPSERKDPNSNFTYYAYSWAHTLSDGTHVVDLHLASSANGGSSFTYAGPLYQSYATTQSAPVSSAYAMTNDTSTETIDLLPIPLTGSGAGQTLWVQAHQSYLVQPQTAIYNQLDATSVVSLTALQLAAPMAANAPTALLALTAASTPEARLGAAKTDPTRGITQNLAALSSSTAKCANFGQPALWYQSGTLYLALECSEDSGNGNIDANELAHFLYAATPSGADASKWVWAYAGEFATPAQAAKLGALSNENVNYQLFTEPEFVQTKSGQLAVILTPSVFNTSPTATQPITQYGCRVVPVTLSTSGATLDIDATTGAPVVLAKVTEGDLYTGVNEGPAACTYEPTATNGIIMGRKYENDPTYGFYIYPVNSTLLP
jgi:hypothetical protein